MGKDCVDANDIIVAAERADASSSVAEIDQPADQACQPAAQARAPVPSRSEKIAAHARFSLLNITAGLRLYFHGHIEQLTSHGVAHTDRIAHPVEFRFGILTQLNSCKGLTMHLPKTLTRTNRRFRVANGRVFIATVALSALFGLAAADTANAQGGCDRTGGTPTPCGGGGAPVALRGGGGGRGIGGGGGIGAAGMMQMMQQARQAMQMRQQSQQRFGQFRQRQTRTAQQPFFANPRQRLSSGRNAQRQRPVSTTGTTRRQQLIQRLRERESERRRQRTARRDTRGRQPQA